jgi:hypothetical protein
MKLFTSIFFIISTVLSGNHAFAAAGYNLQATTYPQNATQINHPVAVNITVSSSGAAAGTYVTNIQLTATSFSNPTSSRVPVAFTQWNPFNTAVTIAVGSNATTTIGAGPLIFFAPSTGVTGSGTGQFIIGGNVYLSDGTVNQITIGAQIKINPIALPAYEL